MSQGSKFNFQKFLRKALDEDFMVVAGISLWIWIFSVLFILFTAHGFHNYLWLPFIPLLVIDLNLNRTLSYVLAIQKTEQFFSDAALDLGRELDLTCEVGDVQGLKSISLNDTKVMAMELMQIMKENVNSRRKGSFGGKKVLFFL